MKRPNPDTFERGAFVFPYERQILNGKAYFYLKQNVVSKEAVEALREGERRDPAAADLVVAEMQMVYMLGQNADVLKSFAHLQKLAPLSWFVENVKELSADPSGGIQ